jgi:hypothetical protein
MDENQKIDLGDLEKLALLADSMGEFFPNGKSLVVFELTRFEYMKFMSNFRDIDRSFTQFTVEISGVDFHFMIRPEDMPNVTPDITSEDK